jgi:hypothetical protein
VAASLSIPPPASGASKWGVTVSLMVLLAGPATELPAYRTSISWSPNPSSFSRAEPWTTYPRPEWHEPKEYGPRIGPRFASLLRYVRGASNRTEATEKHCAQGNETVASIKWGWPYGT